jgi:phosphoenolpyruvate carboxykinase (ATP)
MPPIAKLSTEDAIFYFLSGYTSKVAGTERGLSKQPQATFSTCFGEPFWPLTPNIYADLLRDKITSHHSNVWLINTGWTAGGYQNGYRMPLPYTRQMVNWVLADEHLDTEFYTDPYFKLQVPASIPGVPDELLFPEKTWSDQAAFKRVAEKLRSDFAENFTQFEA